MPWQRGQSGRHRRFRFEVVSEMLRPVSDDASSPATGSASSTTSGSGGGASGGGASGSSHERSASCSSGVDPDRPDVVRRDRTGSGPYGRSADDGVCPASLGGVEGCMASLSGIKHVVFGRIVGRDGTRHGRVGRLRRSRRRRDMVEAVSRRCPYRRSSIVSLPWRFSPPSTRRQLAPRCRRSLHPAQGSCWRSQPRCCVVGSFDRGATGVPTGMSFPSLRIAALDAAVGRLGG